MKKLKVITYNAMASPFDDEERYKLQVAQLRQSNADVICLQELFSDDVKRIYTEGFKDKYEVISSGSFASLRPKFVSSLLNFKLSLALLYALTFAVPYFDLDPVSFWLVTLMFSMSKDIHIKIPSLLYGIISVKFPRMRDLLEGDTLGLMVLVNKSTLSVNHKSIVRLVFKNQAFKPSWTSIFEWLFKPKGLLAMQVNLHVEKDQEVRNSFLLVNTHLNVGLGNKQRFAQVEELAETVEELSRVEKSSSHLPIIMVGDKNADALEPEIHFLRNDKQFCDTFLHCNGNDLSKGATWDNANPLTNGFLVEPNQRLDYIFLKQQDAANSFLTVESSVLVMNEAPFQLSDHYGVQTTLIAAC